MAVTCSEEAKQAINLITPRLTPGFSPVHVIEASWPMQRCAVKAQLSRERNLTLLEKYTLRAFNEIPDVSAAEIAERLGLKQPELIEEALASLTRSEAIETHQPESDDQSKQLREDIESLEFQLENKGFKGSAIAQSQIRKLKRLKRQLKRNEKGYYIIGALSNAVKRLLDFRAKVTESGKKQLRIGKITEPTKNESFELVRCLGSQEVILVGGKGVNKECLLEVENWNPLTNFSDKSSNPTRNDIENALKDGGLIDSLIIQSFECLNDLDQIEFIDICITLAISNENKEAEFFVHRKGSSVRLKWIESFINNDKKIEQTLLKRFSDVMKTPMPAKKIKSLDFNPVIYINRLLNHEISTESRGMVVTKDHKSLLKLTGKTNSYDELFRNRTIVNLSNVKKWKLIDGDLTALKFELPMSGTTIPESSISTANGSIYPAQINIRGKINSSFSVNLPVLCFNRELGFQTITNVNNRLKQELDKKTCFLLSRNVLDFKNWMIEQIRSMNDVHDINKIYQESRNLSRGTSFDVLRIIFDTLVDERFDLFEKDVIGNFENLVNILENENTINHGGWMYVEPIIQQAVLDSIVSIDGGNNLAKTWLMHNNGKKRLAWEDAARLENCRFGHCNSTKFEALRYFEDIINELAEANEVSTESVAVSLTGLLDKKVINQKIRNDADIVRRDRNSFTHEANRNASLQYTLRVIKLMRELISIGIERTGGYWEAPLNTKWENNLSNSQALEYITESSIIIKRAVTAGRPCRGSIWVNGLIDSIPKVFDSIPMDIIRALSGIEQLDSGPQFSDLIEQVANDSVPSWIESFDRPTMLDIPSSIQKIIDEFDAIGKSTVGALITERYLSHVQNPSNMAQLGVELNNFNKLVNVITPANLNIRWKRSISDKAFASKLKSLEEIDPKILSNIGKPNLELLFRKSLRGTLSNIQNGDVEGIISVCDRLTTMMKSDDLWYKIVKQMDGFLGAECSQKIRSGDDIIRLAETVKKYHPIVDKEELPKTNARFEEIIAKSTRQANVEPTEEIK